MIKEGAIPERRLRQSIDWPLVGTYLLLVFIGWVNIYASIHSSNPASIFDWSARCGKQFIWMLTGFGLAGLILYVIPPKIWEALPIPMYLAVLGLLVLVIFVSKDVKGSHSWFELGPVKFQPAEISKITTSLLLAFVLSQQHFKMSRFKDFLLAVAVIAVPMLIIVAESETGSALVYAGFIFVLYREGLSGWWLGLIGLVIGLFISTLTLGTYWSIVLLLGVLVLINALSADFWKRLGIGGVFVVLMALLPWGMDHLYALVQARMDWMADVTWVPAAGESQEYFWSFLLQVKPVFILLALSVLAIPPLALQAYRKKDSFLGITLLVFIGGILLGRVHFPGSPAAASAGAHRSAARAEGRPGRGRL